MRAGRPSHAPPYMGTKARNGLETEIVFLEQKHLNVYERRSTRA